MSIRIIQGTHSNGEQYWAVGPIAYRTLLAAQIALANARLELLAI